MKYPSKKHPALTRQVGDKVVVRAWWTYPAGRLVLCRIEHVSQPWAFDKSGGVEFAGYYDVRPVNSPGAHARMIREEAIKIEV